MNTLSKVFVVLNLVFAIAFCFMTLTLYSKRVDWKDRFQAEETSHTETKEDLGAKIIQLNEEKDHIQDNLDLSNEHRKELTSIVAEREQSLKDKNDDYLTAENKRRILQERLQAQNLELERRHGQIDRMHRIVLTQQKALEVAKANMRNAVNQKMEMENEYNNARAHLVAVQKEKARLENDLHHQSWIINKLMERGVPVRDLVFGPGAQPEAPVHATVVAVRPEVNLVMLSVGEHDRVKRGHEFTVYRRDRFIGKVRVEEVFADMCSAAILPDWTKEKVEEGDDASSGIGEGGT